MGTVSAHLFLPSSASSSWDEDIGPPPLVGLTNSSSPADSLCRLTTS